MGKASAKQEVTEYRMSIHYGVCRGPGRFKKITIADKVIWQGDIGEQSYVDINLPNLFGGPTKEGGVAGRIYFLPGKTTQVMPAELAAKYGLTSATCPAYRGMMSLYFTGNPSVLGLPGGTAVGNSGGFYWTANSPFIQAIKVEVECEHTALNSTNHVIGNDINFAHAIYECLVNQDFGMGAPEYSIDQASFETLAQTLVTENFGGSLMWSRQSDIETFISEMIDHIQATIFVHPASGLLSILALRDDYVESGLREINPGNAKCKSLTRKLWGETANEIVLTWTNPANEQEETITGQDSANMAIQGSPISDTRNMYAIRNVDLAQRILDRELRQTSAPLLSGEFDLSRELWDIVPGEVLRLNWPKYDIFNAIVRVVDANFEDGKVVISILEDIFSLSKPDSDTPPSTGWDGAGTTPTPIDQAEIFTLPYFLAAPEIATRPISPEYPEVMAGILAYEAATDVISFDLMAEAPLNNGEITWQNYGSKSVLGRAELAGIINQEAVTEISGLPLVGASRGPQVGGFVIFGAGDTQMEIGLLREFTSGTWTVDRGVLDTVPRSWAAGTPVWFIPPNAVISDNVELRAAGESVEYKLLTRTGLGTLPLASAPTVSGTMSARPYAPLRPANVKINGVGFGEIDATGASNLTVTWSTRNRLFDETIVTPWTDGPVTPEQNQMTNVTVYRESGVKMFHVRGLYAENSLVIPINHVQEEDRVFIRVSSQRDGITSIQSYGLWVNNIPFDPTPDPPPADINEAAPPPPPPPPPPPSPDPTPGLEDPPIIGGGGGAWQQIP